MEEGTFDFYQQRAAEWAAALPLDPDPRLDAFLDRLPPGAAILELGCGDGRDAEHMIARGFAAHPSDGSPEMARLASERLGFPVPVMRFAELEAAEAFDAVWCQASLLHVAGRELPAILAKIYQALRPGGWHWASYKDGTGDGCDEFGRFFSYIPAERLEAAYRASGPWSELTIGSQQGTSFFGRATVWHDVLVRK